MSWALTALEGVVTVVTDFKSASSRLVAMALSLQYHKSMYRWLNVPPPALQCKSECKLGETFDGFARF